MEYDSIINLAYVIAATLFVFGIKMLGSADTARRGNMISGIGMLIAVVVTLLDREILDYKWIAAGLIIGALIGGIAARVVKMTSMPELVALFNGFGGFASLLVAWAELEKIESLGWLLYTGQMGTPAQFSSFVIFLAMLIGGADTPPDAVRVRTPPLCLSHRRVRLRAVPPWLLLTRHHYMTPLTTEYERSR